MIVMLGFSGQHYEFDVPTVGAWRLGQHWDADSTWSKHGGVSTRSCVV